MNRIARMQKLLELRKKKLDDEMTALGVAQKAATRAKEHAEALARQALAAEARHGERMRHAIRPDEWSESQAWVESERRRAERADAERDRADKAVLEQRQRMLAARTDVERVEALLERMASAARKVEATRERKLDDEFSRRAASRSAAARDRNEEPHPS
jgi:flagellar export protein FliJ